MTRLVSLLAALALATAAVAAEQVRIRWTINVGVGLDADYCPAPATASSSLGGWPMAGSVPQRTSHSPTQIAATTDEIEWYRPIGDFISGPTQLVTADGKVFVATVRGLIVLDAEDGELLWRHSTELPVTTPTVSGNYVYVPGMGRQLWKLDIDTGAVQWTFTGADGGWSGNPIVTNGVVLNGNRDGSFYSIDDAAGTENWSYATDAAIMASAACNEGAVYFASQDLYAYALNADTGSLVWKSASKLHGLGQQVFWPVIFDDYVIFSTAFAYRYNEAIGAFAVDGTYGASASGTGSTAGRYFTNETGTVGDTSTSGGSDGWTSGDSVVDTTSSPVSNTLEDWNVDNPARRTYTALNISDGVEGEVVPLLFGGSVNEVPMELQPGVVDPVEDSYISYSVYGISGGNIPRARALAWKPTATVVKDYGSEGASDEPHALSLIDDALYMNLCCDREGARITNGAATIWDYATPNQLWQILPSYTWPTAAEDPTESVCDANSDGGQPVCSPTGTDYDPMWRCYSTALQHLNCYFTGPYDTRSGVYGNHGFQAPIVPHAFTNASETRVERLFAHRSNTIIAIGTTANKTALAPILEDETPDYAAETVTQSELEALLEAHVDAMLDPWRTAGDETGFYNPAYILGDSVVSNTLRWPEDDPYWQRPIDTIWALAEAYPHLSSGLQTDVASYLSAYWTEFMATTPVRTIGWTRANRANADIPSEVTTAMASTSDSTGGAMHQRVFYAAWKYALNVAGVDAETIYDDIASTLINPMTSQDVEEYTTRHNEFLTGYYGFLELYDLAGHNPSPSTRSDVASDLSTLLASRITGWETEHPFSGGSNILDDNPGGTTGDQSIRRVNCARNFFYMSDELGAYMAESSAASTILDALGMYEDICAHWFRAWNTDAWKESLLHQPYDMSALFQAKAHVAGASQAELSKWIDVPWLPGDLYYIQNLVTAIEAPDVGATNVVAPSSINAYEKFEVTFDVSGMTATNSYVPYDASPPTGIPSDWGITVDLEYSDDSFTTTYSMPCFVFRDYTYETRSSRDWLYPNDEEVWKCRVAFPTADTWEWRIRATDAGGTSVSSTRSITVGSGSDGGFVRVAASDSRYFELEDGTDFWPLGTNDQDQWGDPIDDASTRMARMDDVGATYLRKWMAPAAIQGSSWHPWYSSQNNYGGYIPSEGLETLGATTLWPDGMYLRLAYNEDGMGDENTNTFYDAVRIANVFRNPVAVEQSTDYRITVTYRTYNLAGPRDNTCPTSDYGLVIKMQDPGSGTWHTGPDGADTAGWNCGDGANSSGLVISDYVATNTTTTTATLTGDWSSGSNDVMPPLYLALENVCATLGDCDGAANPGGTPSAYVERVEMHLLDGSETVGPNLLSKSNFAEFHYTFDQKMAYAFDQYIETAETENVKLQLVMFEKDDYILGRTSSTGEWESQDVANFYGSSGIAVRWLQDAWLRYVQGRWGYSTSVASWELLNEGSTATAHRELANTVATTMHAFAPNDHLVTTSVATGLSATFWNNMSFQEPDYYSVHCYPYSTCVASEVVVGSAVDTVARDTTWSVTADQDGFESAMRFDGAWSQIETEQYESIWSFSKPLMRGETGPDDTGVVEHASHTNDTDCTWWHNQVWASIGPASAISLPFWTVATMDSNAGPDASAGNGCFEVFTPFSTFISNIPWANGNYVDAAPTVSSTDVRAVGQKDTTNERAHLWIQHRTHTWCADVGSVSGCTPTWADDPLDGTVTVAGFANSTMYDTAWTYFDEDGVATTDTGTVTSDGSGNVEFDLSTLASTVVDAAVKIGTY